MVSGYPKSTGILRVDWLSMGPLGFGATQGHSWKIEPFKAYPYNMHKHTP